MSCPLCRERKGKRQCPAKGERICAACCGGKRLVEIDCPKQCVWLGAHAGAWTGRETEKNRDARRVAPQLAGLGHERGVSYLAALASLAQLRTARKGLGDRPVLDALLILRKTVETRRSGLVYEHTSEDPATQDLVEDLSVALGVGAVLDPDPEAALDVRESSQRTLGTDDLLAVLGALVDSLSETLREGGRTEFLDTATRITARLREDSQAGPQRLIVEP